MIVFNVSKTLMRKFSKTSFKKNIEMKRDHKGKWILDGVEDPNAKSHKFGFIAKISLVLTGTLGIFFVMDQIGKQPTKNGDTFEESNKLKLIRAWNGFFKNMGKAAKEYLEEKEKKKDQEIQKRVFDEAEHLNLKNVQIVKISKE